MLMQFDPFREFDRLAEQLAAGAPTPRRRRFEHHEGDEVIAAERRTARSPASCSSATRSTPSASRPAMKPGC